MHATHPSLAHQALLPTQTDMPAPTSNYALRHRRDAYLPGVQALCRSLRLVESGYPLVVMCKGVRWAGPLCNALHGAPWLWLLTASGGAFAMPHHACSQSALDALAKEGMQLQFTEHFEVEGGERGICWAAGLVVLRCRSAGPAFSVPWLHHRALWMVCPLQSTTPSTSDLCTWNVGEWGREI